MFTARVRHTLRREGADIHRTEVVDQTVIPAYFDVGIAHECPERACIVPEILILFGGFVARIGEIEDVSVLLRIEHQGVLLALVQRIYQLFHDLEALLLHVIRLPFKACVVVCKLYSKHGQRACDVAFFQNGARRQ